MRKFPKSLAAVVPALAIATGAGATGGASDEPRALALNVIEGEDSVEIELVANSPVTQQVEYEVDLEGNSRSRHRGNTSLPAGESQVLSRMKTSASAGWCATVTVSEASGAKYTLTAGDCARA